MVLNAQLLNVIMDSVNIITYENRKISDDLITFDPNSHNLNSYQIFGRLLFHPNPWFYSRDNNYCTPQEEIFGYYVLRNLVLGIIRSYHNICAGDLLLKHGFISHSLLCYYNASLHSLISFLAIKGKVLITEVRGNEDIYRYRLSNKPKVILGEYDLINNLWIFTKKDRSHLSFWKEIINSYISLELPEYFDELISYIANESNIRPTHNRLEYINNILFCICNNRHLALYYDQGLDRNALDAALNQFVYGRLNAKSEAYRNFSSVEKTSPSHDFPISIESAMVSL